MSITMVAIFSKKYYGPENYTIKFYTHERPSKTYIADTDKNVLIHCGQWELSSGIG